MYIIRHGETKLNVIKAFQGHIDSGLTAKGIQQARTHACKLKSCGLKQITCSDLPRATHTASIVAEILDIPMQTDTQLREVYFGFWDGMADVNIQQQYPQLWKDRASNKWQFNGYNGESYEQAHKRAQRWLSQNYAIGTLIVCHRTFGKILRGAYAGLTPKEIMATDFLHQDIYRLHDRQIIHLISAF
jgi:probable phosphoglycerate mutase